MSLSDLMNTMVCCSCGLCCSKAVLCKSCELATLRANGLPENLQSEITGLKKENMSMVWGSRFEFSELGDKLKELIKQQS